MKRKAILIVVVTVIIIVVGIGFATQFIARIETPKEKEQTLKTPAEETVKIPEGKEKSVVQEEQKFNIPLKKIAFVSEQRLYLINSDGSNLVQIANISEAVKIKYPTWSPDRKYIAVVAYFYKDFEWPVILIVEVKTGKIIELSEINTKVDATKEHLKWSPDGQRLIFCGYEYVGGTCKRVYDVFIVNFERGFESVSVEKLGLKSQEKITGVDWSPDGKRIAYSTRKSIHIINLEERKYEKNYTLSSDPMLEITEGFAWDGKNFLFSSDGSFLCILTAEGEIIQLPSSYGNIIGMFPDHPSWLDKQTIVFDALVYDRLTREKNREICLLDITTYKMFVLTKGEGQNQMPSCEP